MKLTQIPIKNRKQIVSRSVEKGELIIFIDKDYASLLEGTTQVIWELINGKRSVNNIIFNIQKKYNDNPERIKRYTLEAMKELKKINAIYFKK